MTTYDRDCYVRVKTYFHRMIIVVNSSKEIHVSCYEITLGPTQYSLIPFLQAIGERHEEDPEILKVISHILIDGDTMRFQGTDGCDPSTILQGSIEIMVPHQNEMIDIHLLTDRRDIIKSYRSCMYSSDGYVVILVIGITQVHY